MVKIQFANPRLSLLLSLFYPLRIPCLSLAEWLRLVPTKKRRGDDDVVKEF